MIKFFIKPILYITLFIVLIFVFLPKINLYYLAERYLEKEKVYISNEIIDENLFSLKINMGEIVYNDLECAFFKSIDIKPYLFSNEIVINKVSINKNFKNFIPDKIDNIMIFHNILNPTKIFLEANGNMGVVTGEVNLIDRDLIIYLTPSKKMLKDYKIILKQMKKDEKGYKYEYKF